MDRTLTAAVVFLVLTFGQPVTRILMGPAFTLFRDLAEYVADAGRLPI